MIKIAQNEWKMYRHISLLKEKSLKESLSSNKWIGNYIN